MEAHCPACARDKTRARFCGKYIRLADGLYAGLLLYVRNRGIGAAGLAGRMPFALVRRGGGLSYLLEPIAPWLGDPLRRWRSGVEGFCSCASRASGERLNRTLEHKKGGGFLSAFLVYHRKQFRFQV